MITIWDKNNTQIVIIKIPFPFIHIDINDYPEDHFYYQNKYLVEKLDLEFFDLTPEDFKNSKFLSFKEGLFSEDQALLIVQFLSRHQNIPLFVNCYKGVSRSAAIAKFTGNFRGEDVSWIIPPQFQPNPYILKVLNNVSQKV